MWQNVLKSCRKSSDSGSSAALWNVSLRAALPFPPQVKRSTLRACQGLCHPPNQCQLCGQGCCSEGTYSIVYPIKKGKKHTQTQDLTWCLLTNLLSIVTSQTQDIRERVNHTFLLRGRVKGAKLCFERGMKSTGNSLWKSRQKNIGWHELSHVPKLAASNVVGNQHDKSLFGLPLLQMRGEKR